MWNKKIARIESKLNAKRESWIWLNEEWTCFIYTITRCSVIYTYRLVMINMQQYDLIQHFIQNIKWSLIFRLILVLSLCARVCVCKINGTHRDVRTIKSSFFLFNDQTKNYNCFVFAHCFRLTHMPPIFWAERKEISGSSIESRKYQHNRLNKMQSKLNLSTKNIVITPRGAYVGQI